MSLVTTCSSLRRGAQRGSLFQHRDDRHPQHLCEYVLLVHYAVAGLP